MPVEHYGVVKGRLRRYRDLDTRQSSLEEIFVDLVRERA